jgi:1,2-diacylglycerol 3-beta-glucosyltransferase
MVSVLIAARNEANNILDCLCSIEKLSYPKEKLQVLIGNDASEDNTAQLVEHFIEDKPYFQLINITEQVANLKGKANVLAQLVHYAKGEYLFFTDADIEVPIHWIEEMLVAFDPNVGVVTGCTTLCGSKVFHRLQAIEWLFSLSFMELLARFHLPFTGMGNNMAVRTKAYRDIGGYETIGFSIVEDYLIFKAILSKGYDFRQLFKSEVLTISKPIDTFKSLMIQRKRWMQGAMQLPITMQISTWLNALVLPLLPIIFLLNWKIGLGIFIFNYSFVTLFVAWSLIRIKQYQLLRYLFIFNFYFIFIYFAMFLNYFLPTKLEWKGRKY